MLLPYAVVIFCTGHVVASPCTSNQHCSSCDADTGRCLTECYTGYYGPECRLPCSSGCREMRCRLMEGGIEICTAGCKPGYFGVRCSVPCRQPQPSERCKKCPQECEDGFCQLGKTCVSGCQDSYYGTNCTECEPGCKDCDRTTGSCKNESCVEPQCENTSESDSTGIPVEYMYYYIPGGAVALVLLVIFGVYLVYRRRRMASLDTVGWYRQTTPRDELQEVPNVRRHYVAPYTEVKRGKRGQSRLEMYTDVYDAVGLGTLPQLKTNTDE